MELLAFIEKTDPILNLSETKDTLLFSGYLSDSLAESAWRPAHELFRGVFARVESKIEIPSVIILFDSFHNNIVFTCPYLP